MLNYVFTAQAAETRQREMLQEAARRRRLRGLPRRSLFRILVDGGWFGNPPAAYPAEPVREALWANR